MHGLPLIINSQTKTLILGSFPSEISLAKQEYYANPGNDFWKVMSVVARQDLTKMAYADKAKMLLDNHIGLWDVFMHCERKGSMDDAIVNETPNDFSRLKSEYPNIKLVLVAGKRAFSDFSKLNTGYTHHYLPSTSGANRRISVEMKAEIIKRFISSTS